MLIYLYKMLRYCKTIDRNNNHNYSYALLNTLQVTVRTRLSLTTIRKLFTGLGLLGPGAALAGAAVVTWAAAWRVR